MANNRQPREYRVYFSEDYRGSHDLSIERVARVSEEEDREDYYCSILLEASTADKKYIVYSYTPDPFPDGQITALMEYDTLEAAKRLCLEVHSHVNDCSPFEVTGMTAGYKEIGQYGSPVEITEKQTMEKLDIDDFEKLSFCVVIDSAGEVAHTLSICPPS